jgi:hypothetical protein
MILPVVRASCTHATDMKGTARVIAESSGEQSVDL